MSDDKFNYPIGTAAVSWVDSNGSHIRIYSTDGYNVMERCNDGGGWYTGALSVPGAQVSATVRVQNNIHAIRVYATFQDTTTEWCWDDQGPSWYQGGYSIQ